MRQRIAVWALAFLFSVLVVGSAFGTVSYFIHQNDRRHDQCVSLRNVYDGQFVMVHFLAGQFHATPAQEAAGVHVLRNTLGPRPIC